MTDSRTKNVSRNIAIGVLLKVFSLLLPFVSRTFLLYILGTDSVGVSTLFTSVLSFLSLAELGFGSAVVYTMYKPIAEGDYKSINALLKYYRKLYRIIGLIILLIGVAIMPFLPVLIKGEAPSDVNLYYLYILFLVNSVISYFFAGYRQSLLIAHQRSDIRDQIALLISILVRIGEIFAIYFTKSLYVYVLVSVFGTVLTNILTAVVTKRMYPEAECQGTIDPVVKKDIVKRLGGLFGTKLNSIVVNQADSLVISAFLGLTLLTQYGNYYLIMNSVSGFVMIVFASMTASIGNKIVKDSKEEVYKLFKRINFVNNWIVGWCSISLACMYHPFMILWVKENLTLPLLMSILMTLYFYVYQVQRTLLTFKDAAGLWYEDRLRPYVSMVLNIVSNLILVQLIGIYGIVVSTILAFTISVPWCNYIVFKHLFHKSSWKNVGRMLINLLITVAIGTVTFLFCGMFEVSWFGLLLRCVVCILLPNAVYFLIFFKTEEFKYFKVLAGNVFRRKI